MNDILKQRLVGALILVALGVVFWPIIFVEPEEKIILERQPIPPPPGISTTHIEEPTLDGLRASPEVEVADDTLVEDVLESDATGTETIAATGQAATDSAVDTGSSEVRTQAPAPLAMDSDGVPVAWTLQVATVSSADKAEKLRKQLLDMNQKAYVTKLNRGGKTLYRVCIGPKFERVELENLRIRIDAEFKVTSMVARYAP